MATCHTREMHRRDASTEVLTQAIVRYAVDRVRSTPPLDGPRPKAELRAMVGRTITDEGIGGLEALRIYEEVLAPACISVDHPRFLSFVPAAPTEASVLFDLVVGASSICAVSWLEASGAIFAENETLRWLAEMAGLPEGAGGAFVSGGTAGNLSALVAARAAWRAREGEWAARRRGAMLASAGTHSSVAQSAAVMDVDLVEVPVDERDRLTGTAVGEVLAALTPADRRRVFAVTATAGTTNAGVVDDLSGVAEVAGDNDLWFHVDAAYGGAGLVAPSVRTLFDGIEHADSIILDPHKWLFAPFDACALIYRRPEIARAAHTQHAGYLDVLHARGGRDEPWNASDYAHHLSRRARGLPLWFSVATHGVAAYRDAVEATLATTRQAAELVEQAPHLELVLQPELSVVVFRRLGWDADRLQRWSDEQLAAGQAFVTPTDWRGESVLRICIVNPLTTADDIAAIIASLSPESPQESP